VPTKIDSLVRSDAELTQCHADSVPVVLMTRIRLARNLAELPFPQYANRKQRNSVFATCRTAICNLNEMQDGTILSVDELSELERRIMVERHLVSRELAETEGGSGVVIRSDQSASVMINEEDHLRIQCMMSGFKLNEVWKSIDQLDNLLEEHLDYAFSDDIGYLTACPTNVGTGLRASVMMHLPGLVITKSMEKVIRAVNQLGLVVRGWLGEGSEASGSIFQISNQQTLGESESTILQRLSNVLKTISEQENNARLRLLRTDRSRLMDRIGRAYGVLRNGHLLSSNESMSLLSLIRLGSDFNIFPDAARNLADRLFIESQPGHVQYFAESELESAARDSLRADIMRKEFTSVPEPSFTSAPS